MEKMTNITLGTMLADGGFWFNFYIKSCWYLVMLYFVLEHDEGCDELASALGQV
jgi:hypothetical protein